MSEIWLAILFSVTLATLSCSQDFFGILRSGRYWIPVNSPPHMIGDDYHYFSLLAILHRKVLNRLAGFDLHVIPFSVPTRFQLGGMVLNLVPYSFGYFIGDRRYGILGVRLFNRFWLFLAAISVSILIISEVEIYNLVLIGTLIALVFFLTYPPPVTTSFVGSIAWNFSVRTHVLRRASSNDLTRAMYSETSGPIILWGVFFCLAWLQTGSMMLIVAAFTLAMLAFFTYWPAAVVSVFLIVQSGLFLGNLFVAMAAIVGLAIGTFLYHRALRASVSASAFFLGKPLRDSLTLSKAVAANIALVLVTSVAMLILSIQLRLDPIPSMLLLGLSPFALSLLFGDHHFTRLWERGAQIPFALLLTAQGTVALWVSFNLGQLSPIILSLTLVGVALLLPLFEFRQLGSLAGSNAHELDENLMRKLVPRFKGIKSEFVNTHSLQEANAVVLYTSDWTDLHNFSIQADDVQTHLKRVLRNFKSLGFTLADVTELLTSKVEYSDWIDKRPCVQGSEEFFLATAHTLQFMATNREHNYSLKREGLFDITTGWTDKYRDLLNALWMSIVLPDVPPQRLDETEWKDRQW